MNLKSENGHLRQHLRLMIELYEKEKATTKQLREEFSTVKERLREEFSIIEGACEFWHDEALALGYVE